MVAARRLLGTLPSVPVGLLGPLRPTPVTLPPTSFLPEGLQATVFLFTTTLVPAAFVPMRLAWILFADAPTRRMPAPPVAEMMFAAYCGVFVGFVPMRFFFAVRGG